MPDEIPPPEIPAPVPPATPPGETVPAPPPAANLVQQGEVKSERELELERRLEANERLLRDREQTVAERERDIQELKKVPATPPPAPKAKKSRGWTYPAYDNDDE